METRTVQQVAAILKVSRATVYQLCAQRKLPHLRVGVGRGAIRIRQEDLDSFIAGAAVRQDERAPVKCPGARLKHLKI